MSNELKKVKELYIDKNIKEFFEIIKENIYLTYYRKNKGNKGDVFNNMKKRFENLLVHLRHDLMHNLITEPKNLEYRWGVILGFVKTRIVDDNFKENNTYSYSEINKQFNNKDQDGLQLSIVGITNKFLYDINSLIQEIDNKISYYKGESSRFYSYTFGWLGIFRNRCTHNTMAKDYEYFKNYYVEPFRGDLITIKNSIEVFNTIIIDMTETINVENYDDRIMTEFMNNINAVQITI